VGEGIACQPRYKKEKTFKLKLYCNRNKATVILRDLAMNHEETFSLNVRTNKNKWVNVLNTVYIYKDNCFLKNQILQR